MGARYWPLYVVIVGLLIAGPLIWIASTGYMKDWLEEQHLKPSASVSGEQPLTAERTGKAGDKLVDTTQWQVPGAWGFHVYDVINSFLLLVTLVYVIRSVSVAESALNKSHHAYVQSLVDSRYDAMDRLYFDLLKERRQRAYPAPEAGGVEGDPYPLMVWNFIETIVDKCERDPSGELMRTWAPLISAEAMNFGPWMLATDAAGNCVQSPYFKNEFMLLAKALVPVSREALGAGKDLDGAVFLRLFRALEKINDVAQSDARTIAVHDPKNVWLKPRLEHKQFKGFDDAAFLAVFDRIYHSQPLRALAADKWSLPDAIKNDDVKNNEQARADYIQERYRELIEAILQHAA